MGTWAEQIKSTIACVPLPPSEEMLVQPAPPAVSVMTLDESSLAAGVPRSSPLGLEGGGKASAIVLLLSFCGLSSCGGGKEAFWDAMRVSACFWMSRRWQTRSKLESQRAKSAADSARSLCTRSSLVISNINRRSLVTFRVLPSSSINPWENNESTYHCRACSNQQYTCTWAVTFCGSFGCIDGHQGSWGKFIISQQGQEKRG